MRRHSYKPCCTVTRLSLQAAGLVAKAKRRGAHRMKKGCVGRCSLGPGKSKFRGHTFATWLDGEALHLMQLPVKFVVPEKNVTYCLFETRAAGGALQVHLMLLGHIALGYGSVACI